MKLVCAHCDNLDCSINKYCTPEWKEKLGQYKVTIEAQKGQQIIYEGTHADQIYYIYAGKVKVFKSLQGGEQIVRLAKAGDILGHRGYGVDFKYPISATALTDCTICIINNEIFFQALKENPELAFNLMLFFASELKNSETKVARLTNLSAKAKVAEALLYLRDVFGMEADQKNVAVPVTRHDLCALAGVRYETLSRTLSELSRKRIARHFDESLEILNEEALRKLSDQE